MKIKWLGHSCFLMISESGVRVLTDPFDSHVGYALPAVEADIVTTSHSHSDHNYIQAVKGSFVHLSETGTYKQDIITVTGIPAFHDEVEGKKRGRNIIFVFEMDRLRIAHCGDLGHIPTEQQVAMIGEVDILLLPVGGTYTVNASEAYKAAKPLKPSIIIPMHFKTPVMSFPIDGVEKFLNEAGAAGDSYVFAKKQEVEVTRDNLESFPGVLVLDYQ